MEKITKLKVFIFDKAQYRVQDSQGNMGLLKVDYINNRFSIEGRLDPESFQELALFAQDILRRKHGVNFSNGCT